MAKVYGKISHGWGTTIVLPIAEAAKLVELIASGLMRDIGSYPDRGLVSVHSDGRPLDAPDLTVLTQAQYDELIKAGHILHQAEQKERAARVAAEKAAAEDPERTRISG
jgi:hypothetical protein